jgi:hypothetical protein
LPHLWPTGLSSGQPPSITARYFSSCPSDSTSRWTPCPPENRWLLASGPPWLVSGFRFRARLGFSIPSPLRPARHYPRVRIWRSSSERQRDFNPPEQRAAQRTLRTPPSPSRLPPTSRVRRLYGFAAPSISRRDEEGFSSCSRVLVIVLSLSPRQSGPPHQSVCDAPCCLHPTVAGSASGATHFRGHLCVHFRYGPMTRTIPADGFVDRFQRLSFLPPCYPSYGASDFCSGGTASH